MASNGERSYTMYEQQLTDRKSVQLAGLIGLYIADSKAVDPGSDVGAQTVRELLEDLAVSASSTDQGDIEAVIDLLD